MESPKCPKCGADVQATPFNVDPGYSCSFNFNCSCKRYYARCASSSRYVHGIGHDRSAEWLWNVIKK